MKPLKKLPIASYALCLILAACGGGGGSSPSATTTSGNGSGAGTGSGSGSGSSSAVTLATATQVVDGTTIGSAQWADGATSGGGNGQAVAGMNCAQFSSIGNNPLTSGSTVGTYTYAHLSIFIDGQQVAVPANIGVVVPPTPLYGCVYPIQTNDETGKIRTLSASTPYTLGQFFSLWGETLSSSNIAGITGKPIVFYINDGGNLTQFTGDPATIPLTANSEITIQIGTPISSIPTYAWTDPPPLNTNSQTFGATVGTQAMWADGDTSSGGQGQTVDSLTCGAMDETYHVHPHLTMIKDGTTLVLPQFIGITSSCYYNLHTHDQSGVMHVETPAYTRRFTLGNFFDVWGEPLSATNVAGITGEPIAVYIDDGGNIRQWQGDIRDIDLFSERSITIQIGSRIPSIPTWNWTGSGFLR
jgi:hypothetical protein